MIDMLTISDFIAFMKTKFIGTLFYNSTIDKDSPQCIGIYRRSAGIVQSVGGPDSSSYNNLSISMVIHWTEDAGACEGMSNLIYASMSSVMRELAPNGTTIIYIELLEAHPIWVGRDEKNIAECVIRANIFYERGA